MPHVVLPFADGPALSVLDREPPTIIIGVLGHFTAWLGPFMTQEREREIDKEVTCSVEKIMVVAGTRK